MLMAFHLPKRTERVAGTIRDAIPPKKCKKDDFSLGNVLNASNRPFLSQPLIGNRTMNEPHQHPKPATRGTARFWPDHGLAAVFGTRRLLW
jgi:hypothetical protein